VDKRKPLPVGIASIAKNEVWFVKNMVLPFWDAIAAVYPPLSRHAARTGEAVDRYAALAGAYTRPLFSST
jgi:hypothetical protein